MASSDNINMQPFHPTRPAELPVAARRSMADEARSFVKKWKKRILFPHHHRLHARYASPAVLKMSAFKSLMDGFFATREMAPRGDRDLYIRYTVREIAVYIVYLFLVLMMTLGLRSSNSFLLKESLKDLFVDQPFSRDNPKTLQSSANVEDFWSYARGVLPDALYSTPLQGQQVSPGEPDTLGILYENLILGVPRLRQIRVRSDSCPGSINFRQLTRNCYPPYRDDLEDTGDRVTNLWDDSVGVNQSIAIAWKYQTEEALNGIDHTAGLHTYSGAGAIIPLTKNKNRTQEIINNLHQNNWITRGTRAVFLDFTVYNANVNLFCVVRIVWEFAATGGVVATYTFRPLRLIYYLTWFESFVVFPSQILFCIFTVYYSIQEILEIQLLPLREYIRDIYHWLDNLTLLNSFICIGFQFYLRPRGNNRLMIFSGEAPIDGYQDFSNVAYRQTQLHNLVAICVFLIWVKVFKFVSFNKTMIQLASTLSRCSQDIAGFAVMFFIVFFAFAQLGYLLFGSQVGDFKTYEDSVFTLLRLLVGEFNFRRVEAANRILGPMFFLAYVFFIFFVLLNMFLAIMTDTYSEVKAEIQAQRNEFEISDYVKRAFNNFRGLFGKRNTHLDAADAVKLAPADGQLTYHEICKSLQRANFTEVEIKIFLGRYGLKEEGSLDEEDTQYILDNLEGSQNENGGISSSQNAKPNAKQAAVKEKFIKMQQRVVNLEVGLTGLIHKIVNLTNRLKE